MSSIDMDSFTSTRLESLNRLNKSICDKTQLVIKTNISIDECLWSSTHIGSGRIRQGGPTSTRALSVMGEEYHREWIISLNYNGPCEVDIVTHI